METPPDATILIVDDEQGPRETFRMILKDSYNIVMAENGSECLRMIKKQRPNLVLLDVRMPDMDGIDVLKEIKNIDSSLPIIIVTAVGTHQTAMDALRLGAQDFIAKPMNIYRVRETVRNALMEAAYQSERLNNDMDKPKKKLPSVDEILSRSYLDTLKTLSKILEARDPYTREHSKVVAKYAILIAKELGFSQEEIEVMEQTSLLHDIGKVGISDLILRKPGKLTPEEWEVIKRHPEIGEEILEPLKLLHIEQSMIRHHHERYDGKGYPDGMKGENIPIYARILAVADTYDAMTSERPYRRALTQNEAIEELKRNSGTQFDPKVVEIFINILNKLNED